MYAVVVTFTLKPGTLHTFLPRMIENAQSSLRDEPDCHRFDVFTDPGRSDEVFLYELYTDRAGFEAHLATAHFQSFDAFAAQFVTGKAVQTFAEQRA